ncbi:MAG: hypothetical protein R3Y57_05710 [Erysipelotrichaceae bacterium]
MTTDRLGNSFIVWLKQRPLLHIVFVYWLLYVFISGCLLVYVASQSQVYYEHLGWQLCLFVVNAWQIYLLFKQCLHLLSNASYQWLVGGLMLWMLSDFAYVGVLLDSMMDSMMLIGFLCIINGLLGCVQGNHPFRYLYLFCLSVSGLVIINMNGFFIGIWAIFYLIWMFYEVGSNFKKFQIMALMFMVGFASFFSFQSYLEKNVEDHFHSMTLGVLEVMEDPEKALNDFGIYSSYTLLKGVSLEDEIKVVDLNQPLIYDEFLDHYTSLDISFYYLLHPLTLSYIVNDSIQSAVLGSWIDEFDHFKLFSSYSLFKRYYWPTTGAYLVMLMTGLLFLNGVMDKQGIFSISFVLLMMCFSLLFTHFIKSGYYDLSTDLMILSFVLDILFIFFLISLIKKFLNGRC